MPWKRRGGQKLRYGARLRHNIREMRKHAPFARKDHLEEVDGAAPADDGNGAEATIKEQAGDRAND